MRLDCVPLGSDPAGAKRNVEKALQGNGKQYPGAMWYHVAEYIEKLQAGYVPFDLNEMVLAEQADLEIRSSGCSSVKSALSDMVPVTLISTRHL